MHGWFRAVPFPLGEHAVLTQPEHPYPTCTQVNASRFMWSSFHDIFNSSLIISRSQWLCGLRHELSSLAQTLGSWVRIPLEAWMHVCVYSVFLLFCVQVAAFRQADPPSKESYRLCKKIKKLKNWSRSNKGL
jgi:hypothetical protein